MSQKEVTLHSICRRSPCQSLGPISNENIPGVFIRLVKCFFTSYNQHNIMDHLQSSSCVEPGMDGKTYTSPELHIMGRHTPVLNCILSILVRQYNYIFYTLQIFYFIS